MRKIYLILLAALAAASCHILDVELSNVAKEEDYYRTEEQFQHALNGVYAILNEGALYGDSMLGRLGLSSDLGYEYYKKDENTVGYYQASTSDIKISNYWRVLYSGINRANMILKHIDSAPDDVFSAGERARIKGETLFFRAYFYYMLVKRFNDVPLVLKPIDDINGDDKFVRQSPAADVYRQCLADLYEAEELVLPVSQVTEGWQVSSSAVQGIIARVALNMAGNPVGETSMYQVAAEYAKKVMDSNAHSLNPSFQQIFINYCQNIYDIKESILEVNFWGDNTGIYQTAGGVGRINGIAASEDSPIGYSMGVLRCNPYLWYLYDAADLRRDWTMSPFRYNEDGSKKMDDAENPIVSRKYEAKFRREYEVSASKSTTSTEINFPILRYSDVLLMYAEAYACQNSSADQELAYECLNQVRRRGHGVAADVPSEYDYTGDDNGLLSEIQDERARELAYEMLRKDDLTRWGIFYSNMKIAGTYIDGNSSSYQKAANDAYASVRQRDELWPIPAREISVNANLKQNPGW